MMARRLDELLERLAVAVEKLSEEPPEITIQNQPPVCPSCGAVDPQITLAYQEGGTGPMSQLVVHGHCQCGAEVFIAIDSFSTHRDLDSVRAEFVEKQKAGYFQQ